MTSTEWSEGSESSSENEPMSARRARAAAPLEDSSPPPLIYAYNVPYQQDPFLAAYQENAWIEATIHIFFFTGLALAYDYCHGSSVDTKSFISRAFVEVVAWLAVGIYIMWCVPRIPQARQ